MTTLARLLKEIVRTTLRAVSANCEKNIDPARDEIVHGPANIHRSTRRSQNRAAFLMDPFHELRGDLHRFQAAVRIEAAVSTTKPGHLRNPVAVVQFQEQRANDVVEPWTQAAARHDPRARLFWIEKELCTRTCELELQPR